MNDFKIVIEEIGEISKETSTFPCEIDLMEVADYIHPRLLTALNEAHRLLMDSLRESLVDFSEHPIFVSDLLVNKNVLKLLEVSDHSNAEEVITKVKDFLLSSLNRTYGLKQSMRKAFVIEIVGGVNEFYKYKSKESLPLGSQILQGSSFCAAETVVKVAVPLSITTKPVIDFLHSTSKELYTAALPYIEDINDKVFTENVYILFGY